MDKKACNLGRRICYLQLQMTMWRGVSSDIRVLFQFDSSSCIFFFAKSGFVIFFQWKWGRFIFVDSWMVAKALHNISECIQKLLKMHKTRMPIKTFKCRPAVCCNPPLQPSSPVPQWIILKHIPDRKCNGQNQSVRDFPKGLQLLHINHFPFSYTLVFIDLLLTAGNLNLPEVYPWRIA